MAVLLDAIPNSSEIPGILTVVVPLACLALVLGWLGWMFRRRSGLS
jgi:hypothetical protein